MLKNQHIILKTGKGKELNIYPAFSTNAHQVYQIFEGDFFL